MAPRLHEMPLQAPSLGTWRDKYAAPGERAPEDTWRRVAAALAEADDEPGVDRAALAAEFERGMRELGWRPGGRILSAAANPERSKGSAINCTVSRAVTDDIEGIAAAQGEALVTLSAGCGIGYHFGTIRPAGAPVNGIGATSGGVVGWMRMFESSCATIVSGGGRRGAQMATLDCRHPDVFDFVNAKDKVAKKGELRHFNLSVLVSDAFMEAVRSDFAHELIFPVHRNDPEPPAEATRWAHWDRLGPDGNYTLDESGRYLCRVWRTVRARDLWEAVMRHAHSDSDPGVIFVDRINEWNPLRDSERLWATNPCGEQPLPPHGACLLGSIDLTAYVRRPLTPRAKFDFAAFEASAEGFSRLLDNVVEVNGLPLEGQRREIESKRRHGMGFLGLGSALNLLGVRYGSPEAVAFASRVSRALAAASWRAALGLAKAKGRAPFFEDEKALEAALASPYFARLAEAGALAEDWFAQARRHGLRWTHATSIAPTGTISFISNNASSGIEPTFMMSHLRTVTGAAGEAKESVTMRAKELLCLEALAGPDADPPEVWVTAEQVSPDEHLAMQAAVQEWMDSAVSKTINLPPGTSYEDMVGVYERAWELGLKGVTIYLPSDERVGVLIDPEELAARTVAFRTADGWTRLRGDAPVSHDRRPPTLAAVLHEALNQGYYEPGEPGGADWPADARRIAGRIVEWASGDAAKAVPVAARRRPVRLDGPTYRLEVGNKRGYVTINADRDERRLHEVFFRSDNNTCREWEDALMIVLSKLMRSGVDIRGVVGELKSIRSEGAAFGRSVSGESGLLGSMVSEIGVAIETFMAELSGTDGDGAAGPPPGADCGACGAPGSVVRQGGCLECLSCGDSQCG